MQIKPLFSNARQGTWNRLALLAACAATTIALTGCGITAADVAAPIKATGASFTGKVHGGQQPVTGATVQLYVANTTGYGSSSFALLSTPVTTTAGGNFNITNDYTCPSSSSLVYITATGGNPGLSSNNANSAMMAALGPCGNLSSSSFISINELTTVASVYALAPFMTGYASVGSSASNVQGLTNAFATVNKLTNVAGGSIPGPTLPAYATAPTTTMNTLADILASCINSAGGVAGDGSNCGKLFTYTTVGSSVPTDTVGALLNIAHFPSQNAANLAGLLAPNAPFQPNNSPTDFTLTVKYLSASATALAPFSTPSASAVDAGGNLWVTSSGNSSVAVLGPQGIPAVGSPYTGGGLSGPSAIAIDAAGNAWITDKTSSKLSVFTPAGVGTQTTATGLAAPSSVSIDSTGLIWITNGGANSIAAVNATGTSVNSSTVYTGAGLSAPVSVAINPH